MDDYTYVSTGQVFYPSGSYFYGSGRGSEAGLVRNAEEGYGAKRRLFGRRFQVQCIICGVLLIALVAANFFGAREGRVRNVTERVGGTISADIVGGDFAFFGFLESVRNFFTRTPREEAPNGYAGYSEPNNYGAADGAVAPIEGLGLELPADSDAPSVYDIAVDAELLNELGAGD